MARPRTVIIRGKRYRIKMADLRPHYDGLCEPPTKRNPCIYLHKSLSSSDLLETIIHEYMHADDWNASETRIANRSRGLTRLLTSFGFRLVKRAKRKGKR